MGYKSAFKGLSTDHFRPRNHSRYSFLLLGPFDPRTRARPDGLT